MRLSLLTLLFAVQSAWAQGFAGLWQTYGDAGAQPESLVRIEETEGGIRGTVIRVFAPPAKSSDPRCEACAGALKDQPIVGMRILQAQSSGEGEILDPGDGRVYRCTLTLVQGGTRLEVRGYVGVPILGRTQTWRRIE